MDKTFGSAAKAYLTFCRKYGLRNVNPRAHHRITVYPELGVMYNRVKKNANTTVVGLLRELETGQSGHHRLAKKSSKRINDLTYDEAEGIWDYKLFTVIRNPYSRVLSAFLDKFRSGEFRQRYGTFELTPDGFRDFIAWLEDGGLTKDAHWDLQKKLLILPLDRYDHIVRLETFEQDMASLLHDRGITFDAARLLGSHPTDQKKRTSSDSRLRLFYCPNVARRVAELYREDFAALKYATEFPEPLAHSTAESCL